MTTRNQPELSMRMGAEAFVNFKETDNLSKAVIKIADKEP